MTTGEQNGTGPTTGGELRATTTAAGEWGIDSTSENVVYMRFLQ